MALKAPANKIVKVKLHIWNQSPYALGKRGTLALEVVNGIRKGPSYKDDREEQWYLTSRVYLSDGRLIDDSVATSARGTGFEWMARDLIARLKAALPEEVEVKIVVQRRYDLGVTDTYDVELLPRQLPELEVASVAA